MILTLNFFGINFRIYKPEFEKLATEITIIHTGETNLSWYKCGNSLVNASGHLYVAYLRERKELTSSKVLNGRRAQATDTIGK